MIIRYKISKNGIQSIGHNYPILGYPINSPEHLEIKNTIKNMTDSNIVVYSPTAFGLGDSIVLTPLPRVLKKKYPNLKFYLLSHRSLNQLFGNQKSQWSSWGDPFTNVEMAFRNNPYVDGYLDLEDFDGDVLTNHDIIYDPNQINEPVMEQICHYFGIDTDFKPDTGVADDVVSPEIYFSEDEELEAKKIQMKLESNYGVFVLSNRFLPNVDTPDMRKSLQCELDKYKHLPFLYFDNTDYFQYNRFMNVLTEKIDMRVQLKLFSQAHICLGFQTGVLDAVCRYTDVRVLPHFFDSPRGWQYQPRINYLTKI